MTRIVGILLVLFIGGTSGCATVDSEGVYRVNYPGNIGCSKEIEVLQKRLVAAGFSLKREVSNMFIYAHSDTGRTAVLVKDWRVSRGLADWCAMECPTSGPRYADCPN